MDVRPPVIPHEEQNETPGTTVRLRLWPAVTIVSAYLMFIARIWLVGSTNHQDQVAVEFAPIFLTIFSSLWWLAFSKAPIIDRLVGYLLFAGAVSCTILIQRVHGFLMFFVVSPVLITCTVVLLLLTLKLSWRMQKRIVLALFLCCTAVFSCMRVEGLSGNLVPILSWRWKETAEDIIKSHLGNSLGNVQLPEQIASDDWPGFRGGYRDSRVSGCRFSDTWEEPPQLLWRRPIGLGWSSFAAIGDYIFTQEQCGEYELVSCYLAATGENAWVNKVETRYESMMGPGPRATPTYDRGRLYTIGGTGCLQCIDAEKGTVLWTHRVALGIEPDEYGWGYSCSPLVVGDQVLVFCAESSGKSMVAFDTLTGATKWRSGSFTETYSSPQLFALAGVAQVLLVNDSGLQAFAAENGLLLWDYPWPADKAIRVTQPLVFQDGHTLESPAGKDSDAVVMVGTTDGTKALRVQRNDTSWTVSEEWFARSFRPYFNDYVFHEGFVYGFHGDRLACVDAATGTMQWKSGRCGGQVLLITDMDALLILNEAGYVLLVQTNPKRYVELAKFKALSGKTWNHPVIAHNRLFLRNSQEAACYLLPAP